MKMFYSASTGGFYSREIHGDATPDDALPISQELYASLLGKEIEAGADGMPRERVTKPIAHADLVALALDETRAQRQPIIGVLDGLQASALALGDGDAAVAIETAKEGLRNLTSVDLSGCSTFEEMRLAVKARYLSIAMAAPASVRKAFSEALK